MQVRRQLLLAVVLVVSAAVAPAHASARTTVAYDDCTEVSAAPPAGGLKTAVVVVSFACDRAAVDGRAVGPAAVSEVVALQRDGSFALLRTATDNSAVQRALAAAGLPAVLADEIAITPDDVLEAARSAVTVRVGRSTLHLDAVGAPVTGTGAPVGDEGGLTYWYDSPRGTVTNTYVNTLSGPGQGPGAGGTVIDASQDEQLAGWLGTDQVAAGALVIGGSWTATVARRR